MPERKSGRSRKVVDYCKFGANGDEGDFDDDFADSTPPASKKPKLSNKENKLNKSDKRIQKKDAKHKSGNRKSVDEKIFERELQAALELSISQSDPSQEGAVVKETSQPSNGPPVLLIEDSPTPSPVLPVMENPPVLPVSKPPPPTTDGDDDIQVLETGIEEIPSSRRRNSKPKKYVDSDSDSEKGNDSDFAADEDNESDDDDDGTDDDYNEEDSDSDFGPSNKKGKKGAVQPKSSKAPVKDTSTIKGKQLPAAAGKQVKSRSAPVVKASSKPLATSSPIARKPIPKANTPTSTTVRTPTSVSKPHQNWKPPGLAAEGKSPVVSSIKNRASLGGGSVGKSPSLGGVNIKSPTSGLRIGLSRNMKLKPLHPNLKIQN